MVVLPVTLYTQPFKFTWNIEKDSELQWFLSLRSNMIQIEFQESLDCHYCSKTAEETQRSKVCFAYSLLLLFTTSFISSCPTLPCPQKSDSVNSPFTIYHKVANAY